MDRPIEAKATAASCVPNREHWTMADPPLAKQVLILIFGIIELEKNSKPELFWKIKLNKKN